MIKIIKSPYALSVLAAGGLFLGVMNVQFNTSAPPLFNSVDNFVLFAQEEIKLEQGVQVSSGDVGSNQDIDIQKDAIVNSNFFADKITLDKNTIINGNVSFNKLKAQKDTKILGTQTRPISLPIANLPEILEFQVGTQDFKFAGTNNTLVAGNYHDISLDKQGRLTLTGGIYNLRKLELKDNSTLIFNAPTTLNIRFKLKGQKHVSILPGQNLKPTDLTINYLGIRPKNEKESKEDDDNEVNSLNNDKEGKDYKEGKIGRPIVLGEDSFLNFKLLAPKASVNIGDNTTLRGQILAKKVKIEKGTVVSREEVFEKESNPAKVVEDQGLKFIVNEIIVLFDDAATQADIQQVVDSVGGVIVGFIPTPKIVKIEIQTKTAQELNNKIQAIKNLNNHLITDVVQNLIAQ